MDISEYKEIPEHPEYLVSPSGKVYSTKSNRLLSVSKQSAGYFRFAVRKDNKTVFLLLHRVLARVFGSLPSLDSELEVDHDDGDKENIALDNLVVRTKEEHRIKTTISLGRVVGGKRKQERKFPDCERYGGDNITSEEIEYWVSNYSWVRASKELGLTDNGLRKRYKRLTGKCPKSIVKLK